MGSFLSRHIPQTCSPLLEQTQVCGQPQGLARPPEKPQTPAAGSRSPARSWPSPRPALAESGVSRRALE